LVAAICSPFTSIASITNFSVARFAFTFTTLMFFLELQLSFLLALEVFLCEILLLLSLSLFPLSLFPLSLFPLSLFPLSLFPLSLFPLSLFPLSLFPLSLFAGLLLLPLVLDPLFVLSLPRLSGLSVNVSVTLRFSLLFACHAFCLVAFSFVRLSKVLGPLAIIAISILQSLSPIGRLTTQLVILISDFSHVVANPLLASRITRARPGLPSATSRFPGLAAFITRGGLATGLSISAFTALLISRTSPFRSTRRTWAIASRLTGTTTRALAATRSLLP
jgi:hypothetical protein